MTRGVRLYLVGSIVLVSLAGCGRGFFQTAEREPWRREAEVACLKSGAVKETAELVRINPINGPGMCGAEFPLKVAALGEGSSAFGYADESLRPPGNVGRNQPRWPVNDPPQAYQPQTYQPQQQTYPSQQPYQPQQAYPQQRPSPQQQYPQQQAYPSQQPYASPPQSYPSQQRSGGPVSLSAPGINAPEQDEPDVDADEQSPPQQSYGQRGTTRAPPENGGPGTYPNPYSRGRSAAPGMPVQNPLPRLGPSNGNAVGSIGPVTIKPTATLACPIVSALDRWIAESVQPAATRWLGARVVEIKQISAYSCRGMNGNPNARISEHAFGNALDIAAFILADGRRITIKDGWKGMPEEQAFLREIQASACQQFNTVLAPGSNVYHYDHIHVDLMRRSSGRAICQPGALSPEQIASRAGRNGYAGGNSDPSFTSSIGRATMRWVRGPLSREDRETIEDESKIRYGQ